MTTTDFKSCRLCQSTFFGFELKQRLFYRPLIKSPVTFISCYPIPHLGCSELHLMMPGRSLVCLFSTEALLSLRYVANQ